MNKRKKVWVTKYWNTQGVFTLEADVGASGYAYIEETDESVSYGLHPPDYGPTRAEAVGQVQKKKAAKIASLRKQIAKIEAIDPEEAVPE